MITIKAWLIRCLLWALTRLGYEAPPLVPPGLLTLAQEEVHRQQRRLGAHTGAYKRVYAMNALRAKTRGVSSKDLSLAIELALRDK